MANTESLLRARLIDAFNRLLAPRLTRKLLVRPGRCERVAPGEPASGLGASGLVGDQGCRGWERLSVARKEIRKLLDDAYTSLFKRLDLSWPMPTARSGDEVQHHQPERVYASLRQVPADGEAIRQGD